MTDKLVGTLAWLAVVALMASLMALLVNGRIEHVRFEGSTDERAEIERVIQDHDIGTNMARLERLLTEQVSWIRAARLRFHWPDTVRIEVEREAIVARWNLDEFLTTDGKLVSRPEAAVSPRGALPVLRIARSSPAEVLAVYQALDEGARALGIDILALNESQRGDWMVTLTGGVEVMLGRQAMRERFKRVLLVYQRELHERVREIDGIDARYVSGVAVAWIGHASAGHASAGHASAEHAAEAPTSKPSKARNTQLASGVARAGSR